MDQPVPHTDIRVDGWIGRLPARLRPYALLARLDRPIGTWLLFLPGIWGILLPAGVPVSQRIFLIVLFGIGSVVMRGAGCVVNDMWDRDIDRQVARTAGRPLASGALSMREAALFLAALLLIGFNILMNLNTLSQVLGASSLILVGLYPLAKRVTWWPQLVMGFTFGFGAPLGYAAAADRIDPALCALYAATIVWQLGFDTIYGFQDMEDDARIGVRSTSRLMAGHARLFVGTCYALTVAGLAAAGWLAHTGYGFWLALPLPAMLLASQVSRLDERDPAGCLRLFRFNRETGLVIALAVLAGMLTR
ncbi:4-hydroxybenzoate octaprenyltransferase [Komagataeibacter oboediens]|uniref:4-hydroxybenzoate octaprenyltransferase n=1 Tax=Komagataeibacter oboediens TaxID=65958 RepID=A0ABS5SMD3_9PROT|nr:4-hydroxybenzoate octaprenyltransferase [Komagataeibacter oboediens]MBL7233641.1 4-hydroxybenzoate octaprenyltransferase [Komagataeibacter oboediens]MBT0674947.1 4-hydroxybenzoate octaprenyltransferase [Komagataeibacter oboediens]MBT0678516.1 4-hydroxybenzoate octaprenyltransferase [Komagataeibacter oboediens]MBV0887328.1 4-hydroxybenzoate octaprenyltransferase [Komagataeibacter oboediens]MCK9818843.1 4-hydroxybenzoate octaprenyltransferase [Komagataeibacter oboediens]